MREEMWQYLCPVGACYLFREVGTKRAYVLTKKEYEELKRLNPEVTRYIGEILSGAYLTVTEEFLDGKTII